MKRLTNQQLGETELRLTARDYKPYQRVNYT